MLSFVRSLLLALLGGVVGGTLGANPAAAEPTLDDVVPLVRAGEVGEALTRWENLPKRERNTPPARYLRARLLEATGRVDEAAEAYGTVHEGVPAAVARDAGERRARLLASLGRCPEAEPLLEPLAKPAGNRGAVARALLASCALTRGDFARAVDRLRAVAKENAGPVDTFAVRLQLAEALHRQGDVEGAKAELRSVLLDRPEHPDVARAERELARLGGVIVYSWEERLKRAEKLLRASGPEKVLAELEREDPPKDRALRAEWLHLRGMALFRLRTRYEEASKVLAEAAKLGGTHAIDDAFHAARALSRADRDPLAIKEYRTLVKKHPTAARAAEAEYLAAWLELHHGKKTGSRAMTQYLNGPRGRSDAERAKNGHWYLAIGSFERRVFPTAIENLEKYAKLGSGPLEQGRGFYWLGRALQRAGQRSKAIEAYKKAFAVEALHYYTLLARARLLELGHDPGPAFAPATASATKREPEAVLPEEVAFFDRLGLRHDALETLRGLENELGSNLDRVAWLAAAYQRFGDLPRAYRLVASRARAELARAPHPGNEWAWDAAYPQPHRDEVEAAAAREGVPIELVYAVMRQESGYEPEAMSPAGAMGLLQLMPATAEKLANEVGVTFRRDMLFDPAWNIRFGVKLLGKLLRLFDGNMPLAVAAYNAGEHRVERWRKERGDLELDHFVERIPFDETRNYVRRVMSHYARYRYRIAPEWPEIMPRPVPKAR